MKHQSDNIVFSILQEHPSVAAGICTFAVAFALVAGNAIYAQPGRHPVPLFATRDNFTTQSVPVASTFKPEVRVVNTIFVKPKEIPLPTSRNSVVGSKVPTRPFEPVEVASRLVADIQDALKGTGDYSGEIDGVYGPLTRASIIKFQTRKRLVTNGEVSQGLLKDIRLNEPKMHTGSTQDQIGELVAVSDSTPSAVNERQYDTELVHKIQKGLVNFGDPGVAVDGIFGQRTSEAISKFQRKYNLQVTGKPDKTVLETLVAIKALPSG